MRELGPGQNIERQNIARQLRCRAEISMDRIFHGFALRTPFKAVVLKFVGSLFDENMLLEISAKNIPCFCTTDTFQLQFTRNWFSVVDEDNGMDALH